MSEHEIHPDVLAKMEQWDRLTQRRSNPNQIGPQSAEHRKKIGFANSINVGREHIRCEDGQPLPAEVRARMGEGIRRSKARD